MCGIFYAEEYSEHRGIFKRIKYYKKTVSPIKLLNIKGGINMEENKGLVQTQEIKSQDIESQEVKTPNWEEALENECWIAPLVDIYETENEYVLTANMPGVSKENIKIKIEDGDMVLMGKIDYDTILNRRYILSETELGNYYRKFKISDSIDESKIEAKFEYGQLIIVMPKHERVKPKNIEIK